MRSFRHLFVMVLFVVGCSSSGGAKKEILALVDEGDWAEVKARAQLLRAEQVTAPWLDYAEGMSLLAEDADKPAVRLFERLTAQTDEYTARIAATLADMSRKDLESGWGDRATRRMRDAMIFDSTIDPGAQADRVADRFYRWDKDYDRAFPIYEKLARERPDPVSKHPEWVYRYGHGLELRGEIDAALAVYEGFIAEFPAERGQMRYVRWRQMTILLDMAEEARAQSRLVDALSLVSRALESGWHLDLMQRARYLAGQIEEDRGDFQAALGWYEQVTAEGSKHGGELVDQAQSRLEALREMGVH